MKYIDKSETRPVGPISNFKHENLLKEIQVERKRSRAGFGTPCSIYTDVKDTKILTQPRFYFFF